MYQDLIETNEMNFLGMDLSKTALDVVGENFLGALPYFALIVVVLVSSLVQQKQIRGRNTGAQINPQQEMIMRILPWMLPVFSFTMPAALVVYFVISNLYRIGQQGYITRSLYSGEDSLGAQARRSREEAQAKENAVGASKPVDEPHLRRVSRHQSVPTLVRRPNRRVLGGVAPAEPARRPLVSDLVDEPPSLAHPSTRSASAKPPGPLRANGKKG